MSKKAGAGTLQKQLVEEMGKDPVRLYTIPEIMEIFDIDKVAAGNALYNTYRVDRIMKHKETNDKNQMQYALKIPEHLSKPYAPQNSRSNIKSHKIKKGQMPSSREIRTMFAQTQNQMAKMEDMMIAVVEEAEDLEKMIHKIKNITS